MDSISDIETLSTVCRICLEKSSKMYPLIGPILNVDVDVKTMLNYCTSVELELDEDLPNRVCVPCFRTIRIAYNFIKEFEETNKQLMELRQTLKAKRDLTSSEDEQTNNSVSCKDQVIKTEYSSQEEDVDEEQFEQLEEGEMEDPEAELKSEEIIIQYVNDSKFKNNTNDFKEVEVLQDSEGMDEDIVKQNVEVIRVKQEEAPEEETLCYQSLRRKATVKVYTCPICMKKTTKFLATFVPHLYSHRNILFHCNLCDLDSNMDVEEYLLHYKKLHLYQCSICNKSFNRKSSQYYHMKVHADSKDLKKHQNTHSQLPKYVCSKCGRKFNTYDTFRYHQKTHDGYRKHLCPECGRSFLQSVHLKYHMWKHTGIKRFRCEKCDKSYTSVTQLKKHLREVLRLGRGRRGGQIVRGESCVNGPSEG
ncbi:hypothetical protein NQ318_019867 [Aromia moschata]|uniref:Uncharacterized protein n=1 Tax=Aromia moschata TaxID=1265417 RepID=A0AAV8YJ88_9CUCU|nr:hypothetical protein NQ318_019867 [Aromia moschata]